MPVLRILGSKAVLMLSAVGLLTLSSLRTQVNIISWISSAQLEPIVQMHLSAPMIVSRAQKATLIKDVSSHQRRPGDVWIGDELACTFRDESDLLRPPPLPVVLISTGRAGSSVTWDTVTRLVGKPNVAFEYTGGNRTKSQIFFDSIDPIVGKQWASLQLCQIQAHERVNGSGICGFQWKPYFQTFKHHPLSRAALEEMANRTHPTIRFIFLTRNALDRAISNIKHRGHVRSPDLPAHCAKNDTECVSKHARLGRGVHLPTDDLVHHLREAHKKDDYIEETLKTVGAKFVRVSFERLYDQDDIDEWKKILRFLERGPMHNLTISQVHDAFAIQRTSSRSHHDVLSNYEDIKKTLNGTEFETLLT